MDKAVIIFSVVSFYMEVWTHWFANGGPVPTIFAVYLVFLYGLIRLVTLPAVFKLLTKTGFFWWMVFYFFLIVGNYIVVTGGLFHKYAESIQTTFNYQLTSLGLGLSLMILFIRKSNFDFTIKSIAVAVCIGCFVNFFDILDLTQRWNGPELRAAGFYMNPNGSATSLAFGFAATVFFLPKKIRLPYFFIFASGTFLTLSRGAIPGVFLLFFLLLFNGSINVKSLLLSILSIGLIFFMAYTVMSNSKNSKLLVQKVIYNQGIQNRIKTMYNPTGQKFEAGVRDDVALDHIKFYLKSPLVGNGLASSMYVQKNITATNHMSHVQYIHMLNEWGLFGLFILFALPFSMCWHNRKFVITQEVLIFTFIYLLGCLASHNMFETRSFVFIYALFAVRLMHKQGMLEPISKTQTVSLAQ